MISYEKAINEIDFAVQSLNFEKVTLQKASGCISAKRVISSIEIPQFDNSAMDGFAIRSQDLQQEANLQSISFQVLDHIKAGDTIISSQGDKKNSVYSIMTGAPIPRGYDTVVRVEDVTQKQIGQQTEIRINTTILKGENIRLAGEDFSVGDEILHSGEMITPSHVMALAAVGINEVYVIRTPRIALFCTGDELLSDVSESIKPGMIYNSSGPYIQSLLPHMMATLCHYEVVSDCKNSFISQIKQLLESSSPPDVILTSGGVSVGKYDFIPEALEELGANIIFHKVRIRPGKPILFAKINQCCILGLPGNPVSTVIGVRFFLEPLLRKMLMMSNERVVKAKLVNGSKIKGKLLYFYKAKLSIDCEGKAQVKLLSGQESFKIKPLIKANCWAVSSVERGGFNSGEIIDVYPFFSDRSIDHEQ